MHFFFYVFMLTKRRNYHQQWKSAQKQKWNINKMYLSSMRIPGDPIRPVDPIVFNRIRVGFHRKPTFFIKNRSDPTWFLSDYYRSESGPDFVGIRRHAMKSDQIRPHPTPHESPGIIASWKRTCASLTRLSVKAPLLLEITRFWNCWNVTVRWRSSFKLSL
jgi:hypothetical protein